MVEIKIAAKEEELKVMETKIKVLKENTVETSNMEVNAEPMQHM